MKGSKAFTDTIQNYLQGVAEKDELFKVSFEDPKKKIEECITYILNTVKNSGEQGFEDAEIFNMAIHYYDEDVEVGEKMDMSVIVNHKIELTEEEIASAKKAAIENVIAEQRQKMTKKTPKKAKVVDDKKDEPLTLF